MYRSVLLLLLVLLCGSCDPSKGSAEVAAAPAGHEAQSSEAVVSSAAGGETERGGGAEAAGSMPVAPSASCHGAGIATAFAGAAASKRDDDALAIATARGDDDAPTSQPARSRATLGDGVNAPAGMAWIPGGVFTMGSDGALAYPNERPAHRVAVDGFWMDTTHVTNDAFAAFVEATGYVTTAEEKPDWEAIRVQLPAGTPRPPDEAFVPGAMVFVGAASPVPLDDASQWWRYVPGASWRHPQGPGSDLVGKGDHPVVQVSLDDALAYAAWAGKRLPTEAEWEYAARGGLDRSVYPWGDEMEPDGQRRANTWDARQGAFPVVHKGQGLNGTMPAGSFPANGYGLHDMAGNAWHWVADWYRVDAYAAFGDGVVDNPTGPDAPFDPSTPLTPAAPKRVIRGGSFLCSPEYCLSFRTSARRGSDPASPMSHVGFRLVVDAPAPR